MNRRTFGQSLAALIFGSRPARAKPPPVDPDRTADELRAFAYQEEAFFGPYNDEGPEGPAIESKPPASANGPAGIKVPFYSDTE